MSETGKEAALGQIMDELTVGDLCLAFSGGVDSSLLLKMAADRAAAKGSRVWAVTFDSLPAIWKMPNRRQKSWGESM